MLARNWERRACWAALVVSCLVPPPFSVWCFHRSDQKLTYDDYPPANRVSAQQAPERRVFPLSRTAINLVSGWETFWQQSLCLRVEDESQDRLARDCLVASSIRPKAKPAGGFESLGCEQNGFFALR